MLHKLSMSSFLLMSPVGKPHPKDKFTPSEDDKLRLLVQVLGTSNWKKVSEYMGTRNPRQCRDRYKNYLAPYLNINPWTKDEDAQLIDLVKTIGRKWSLIAKEFPGRTDINIKSRYALLRRQEERENQKKSSSSESESEHFQDNILTEPLIEEYPYDKMSFDDSLEIFDFPEVDGFGFEL